MRAAACVVREVVRRVGGARGRGEGRRPARVQRELVLLGLAHGHGIAARSHRQVGPLGHRQSSASAGRPSQRARRRHWPDEAPVPIFRAAVTQVMLAVGRDLDLGETACAPSPKSRWMHAEADAVTPARDASPRMASGARPVDPQRMRCRALSSTSRRAARRREPRLVHSSCPTSVRCASRNSIGVEAQRAGDLVDHQLGRGHGLPACRSRAPSRNRARARPWRSPPRRSSGK